MFLARAAIDRIADQRMADRRHVDAHLVGAPGLEPAFDQRRVAQHVEPLPVGHRALALARGSTIAIFLRLLRRAGERGVDRPARAGAERRTRSRDSGARCCGRRIACASPSWARSCLATTSSPDVSLSMRWTIPGRATPPIPLSAAAAMVEQGIDHRPVAIARGGVDDQPGGLVDDQQMLVLVDDAERDFLRLVVRRRGGGDGEGERLVALHLGRRVAHRVAVVRVSAPDLVSTFRRSRDSVGTRSASARSRRQPAWLGVERDFERCLPPGHDDECGRGRARLSMAVLHGARRAFITRRHERHRSRQLCCAAACATTCCRRSARSTMASNCSPTSRTRRCASAASNCSPKARGRAPTS